MNSIPRFGSQFRFVSPAMEQPGTFDVGLLLSSMKDIEKEVRDTFKDLGHGNLDMGLAFAPDSRMVLRVPDGPADKIMELYLKSKGIQFQKVPFNTPV